jgi:ADP-L-glycero-D-manno-heptose 6-epimerase
VSDGLDITSLRPLNMYGYSKQLFDLHASRRGYLDRIVGLKYFNVFGPNEDHKADMRSVVNKAFRQIRETGRVRLFKSYRPEFADGEQRRDFLYVKDAVDMTLHLVDEPGAHGLYNIGSGESHTWRELVSAVFSALGRPADIEFIDMPAELRAKYQYSTEAAIDRLTKSGYRQPITPLADAVRDYVTTYLVPDRHLGDELVG